MDTEKRVLRSENELHGPFNEMIGKYLTLNPKLDQRPEDTLTWASTSPANCAMIGIMSAIPQPKMTLPFNRSLLDQVFQAVKATAEYKDWPQNLGASSVKTCYHIFSKVWDEPGEDDAWRDL